MKNFSFVVFVITVVTLIGGCSMLAESKTGSGLRPPPPEVTITPNAADAKPSTELTKLCKQLHEIKQFPGRDPSEQEDPFYAAMIAKGDDLIPCLIDEITNETPTDDPRSAPVWQNYKVGDTAVFMLARIIKSTEILKEMLPPTYREEWKTNGVYAYFNYVSTMENRRQLQAWWRAWLAKHRKRKA